MIGGLPMSALAPMEYRYALDAAMPLLNGTEKPLVLCAIPQLAGEVEQRVPNSSGITNPTSALWVEPLQNTWQAELKSLGAKLKRGAPLIVIASQPMASLLSERRLWQGQPLGLKPGGIGQLRRALTQAGFVVGANYGIHTPSAIGLSLLAQQSERWGWPALGDRLRFAARLRYCGTGPMATLATVTLLISVKESD